MNQPALDKLPQILFEIGKVIGSKQALGTMLGRISVLATELVGADATSVMLLDADGSRLLAKAAHGLRIGNLDMVSFAVGEGVAGWVVQTGESALIDDVAEDERFTVRRDPSTLIRSMLCVPLLVRDEPVGVMSSTSKQLAAFGEPQLRMLEFVAKTISLDIENERLRKVSVTDQLTGCFNREFLHRQLPLAMREADKQSEPLSAAMVDVDHFKAVNDQHGHDTGDRVLQVVAERLRGAIRGDDVLVRYGGEEFLVLLPHTDADSAREIGERMRAKLQDNPIHAGAATVEMRISVGVTTYRGPDDTAENFIRRADTALYQAKGRGRNRVEAAP
jgi:diguanylate cyclase (GGDEF)-like protein